MGRVLLAVMLPSLLAAELAVVPHHWQFDLLTGEQTSYNPHYPNLYQRSRYAIYFKYDSWRTPFGSTHQWLEYTSKAAFVPDKYDDVSYLTAMTAGWCDFHYECKDDPARMGVNTFILKVENETDYDSFRYWKVKFLNESVGDLEGNVTFQYEELEPIELPTTRNHIAEVPFTLYYDLRWRATYPDVYYDRYSLPSSFVIKFVQDWSTELHARYLWNEDKADAAYVPLRYHDVSFNTAMVAQYCDHEYSHGEGCESWSNASNMGVYTMIVKVPASGSFRYWKVGYLNETSANVTFQSAELKAPVCKGVPGSAIEAHEGRGIIFQRCRE